MLDEDLGGLYVKAAFGNATVDVDSIRRACRGNKVTVTLFARGLKDQIIDLMLSLGDAAPAGNLAKTLKLYMKNVTHEEAVWASDFQT